LNTLSLLVAVVVEIMLLEVAEPVVLEQVLDSL
jgi:hypothetical protein